MKRIMKLVLILGCIILGNIFTTNTVSAISSGSVIEIDGYYDDWLDKPYSWEYSHDNPYIIEHYWDGTKNITKNYLDENGNPYNLEIRHKMALYCDGEYVYLHIEISDNPGSGMNGEDYRFYVDGEIAAFHITYPGGNSLTKKDKKMDPGIYFVEVRHRDGGISNTVVTGAEAAFTKKYEDKNNEMELKIPLTALKLQNDDISIDNFNTLEFFCPNLMYRRIACSGISTVPYLGIVISIIFVGGFLIINKQRVRRKKA